ncbi:flavodoxin domain-containing protein [Allobaculum sp. Allo2]|uniref:flavodoxin family protein n=1 Tax=Allobaculum sp. Allo2 TaxID=2853432 RepID=UPI001F613A5E|nr:flavodoxin domain-containing protein [Allobaculum sp. Allo2]UNT94344.1 flavodoxin domain-containing protein [Allobaculum sp. Allo2]
MKTPVIYSSQTGFTKRYANWIASAAHADCLDVSAASTEDLSQYEAIVFGSWISGGYLHDLHWLKDNLPTCPDQKRILYIVGASPSENEEVKRLRKKCLRAFEEHNVKDIFTAPAVLTWKNCPRLPKR